MSKENVFVIDDPSLIGWVEDGVTSDGDPVWKWGQVGADAIGEAPIDGNQYARQDADWSEVVIPEGSSSLWTQDEDSPDIYFIKGKVGIGTSSPNLNLTVQDAWGAGIGIKALNGAAEAMMNFSNGECSWNIGTSSGGSLAVTDASNAKQPLVIDSTGNVGIGMVPEVVTAKEQLAEWKTRFDARLKAEPKADKKAVTLEITDDAFEVMPAEDKLAEWMETRAAGDKLQVGGDISASGTVNADVLNAPIVARNPSDSFTLNGKTQPQYGINFDPIGSAPVGISGYHGFSFATQGAERFSIAGNGDASFSGNISASGIVSAKRLNLADAGTTRIDLNDTSNELGKKFLRSSSGSFDVVSHDYSRAIFVVADNGDAQIRGDLTGLGDANFKSGTVTCASGGRFQVGDEKTYLAKGSIGGGNGTALGSNSGFLLLNNGFERFMPSVTAQCDLGSSTQQFKNGYFSGTIFSQNTRSQRFIQDGSPVVDARGLIETLSTLRTATQDENTIEGLRDAIGNAVGGLIEKFEAMQSTATQEAGE